MPWTGSSRTERPFSEVPGLVWLALVAALVVHMSSQAFAPIPGAQASVLRPPPATAWLRAMSLGEPIGFAQLLALDLQAFDNQPGVSIPFAQLDYTVVNRWLATLLELDAGGHYPLMMASHMYAQVADETKQRQMLAFVHGEFLRDPNRRWRWLAHAALIAKHRLGDMRLALRYAEDITRHARGAANWARQMRIFILEDMGEREAAAVLLGALLESGEVSDENELHFLVERLNEMQRGAQ
jgi:hypothetical protein